MVIIIICFIVFIIILAFKMFSINIDTITDNKGKVIYIYYTNIKNIRKYIRIPLYE